MAKAKGSARVRSHHTHDTTPFKLTTTGHRRTRHRNSNVNIDKAFTILNFDNDRGIELSVFLTTDQLRKHIEEAQAALAVAEADPIACDNPSCCTNSPTAERRDS